MHEIRFINEIFAVLKDKLDKSIASHKPVVIIRLSPFSHVTAENLKQSFKGLSRGGEFEDVRLKILPLEILLECNNCKRNAMITKKEFGCPFCKSMDVNVKMDKEFFVESIEIQRKKRR